MITGDHGDLDVCTSAGSQGLSHVWSGRVLEPDQGEQGQPSLGFALRLAWVPCAFCHCQHPATPLGKIIDDIVSNRAQAPAEDGFSRQAPCRFDRAQPGHDRGHCRCAC